MEQTNILSDYLDGMTGMLGSLDADGPPREPFAARVMRLRGGILPVDIAGFMLTLNTLRVQVVKKRQALDSPSWAVVKANWAATNAWWQRSASNDQSGGGSK